MLAPFGHQFSLSVLNFNFWSFNYSFCSLSAFYGNVKCVFPAVFQLFSPTRILSLSCSCARFWHLKLHVFAPPSAPKSTPKSLRNRVPILSRLRPQICIVLGPLWAPQNRPKIAPRPLGVHLAALELHLGGLSSGLGAYRGLLRTILGAPGPLWTSPGGDFCSILALPGPVLGPPRPTLALRRG